MLVGLLVSGAGNPVALQKANAIVDLGRGAPDIAGAASLDVERIVGGIPFDGNEGKVMVWEIDPDEKYRKTIVEGGGNCSNLVFGLARFLQQSDIDFQIVHMMRPADFLLGRGHTLVRTRYMYAGREWVGLVDVLAGGLPTKGDRPLDVADLTGPIADIDFVVWNGRPGLSEAFFRELPEDVVIGWIPRHEVERYFSFLEWVVVPLPSARLEKYVYDGLALLLGVFPRIYVTDAAPLRDAGGLQWEFFRAALLCFRSAVVVIPLLVWLEWRERS
ncbi:MAG: hypothetical protein ACQGVC_20850 [Myxococcota bacterium]